MADPNTLRILSIDGGGERGYISANFLERFCQQAGIEPDNMGGTFDLIMGNSIGGIQAIAYANGKTPTGLKDFFVEDGPWIFSTSSTVPGVRATTLDKVAVLLLGGTFYSNAALIEKLEEEFGDLSLNDINTNVAVPSYESDTKTLIYFSNVNFPGGRVALAKEAALATAAAPLYFPPAEFEEHTYLDGGVFQNNPAPFALALGKLIKPSSDRFCVLSVGTGRGDIGFDDGSSAPALMKGLMQKRCCELFLSPSKEIELRSIPPTSYEYRGAQAILEIHESLSDDPPFFPNVQLIFFIIGLGVAGPQEANDLQLQIESDYTLQQLYYYRFQYDLDPEVDTELDNTTPEFIEYMQTSSDAHYDSEITNIGTFIGHLFA